MYDYNIDKLLKTLREPEMKKFLTKYFEESFYTFFSNYLDKFPLC